MKSAYEKILNGLKEALAFVKNETKKPTEQDCLDFAKEINLSPEHGTVALGTDKIHVYLHVRSNQYGPVIKYSMFRGIVVEWSVVGKIKPLKE